MREEVECVEHREVVKQKVTVKVKISVSALVFSTKNARALGPKSLRSRVCCSCCSTG